MLLSLAFTGLLVSQSLRLLWLSPVSGGGLGRIDENVVLLELLDVAFDLVHLLGQCFHTGLLAECVEFGVVSLLLVVSVQHIPLLLKGSNQFGALRFRHQELLAVFFVLLLDLHFTHEVVLIFDFVFDLGEVFGHFAKVLLFQIVLVLGGRQVRCSQNVLDGVCNDEILVTHQSVDGLFITFGNRWLFEFVFPFLSFN